MNRTPKSKAAIQKNRQYWSDNRNSAGFKLPWKEACYPICLEEAKGGTLWDIDGNKYVDIAGSFGVNFLGHSHPAVISEVHRQLAKGFALGAQNALAGEVAKLICEFTGNDRCACVAAPLHSRTGCAGLPDEVCSTRTEASSMR